MIFPRIPYYPPPEPGRIKEIMSNIVDKCKRIWAVITGKDKTQDEIANKKGINPQKSEASEIAELNNLLKEYSNNIISVSEKLEDEMIVECVMQLQEILEIFNEYNSTPKIARSESIKRKFKRLTNELKGTFEKYVRKRISLNDSECVQVLKLPAGELKNQRLQELKQKVFIEASNEIIEKIKDTVDDFSETVQDSFEEHLDRTEENMQSRNDAFEKMCRTTEDQRQSIEEVLFNANYTIAMCSLADSLIGG